MWGLQGVGFHQISHLMSSASPHDSARCKTKTFKKHSLIPSIYQDSKFVSFSWNPTFSVPGNNNLSREQKSSLFDLKHQHGDTDNSIWSTGDGEGRGTTSFPRLLWVAASCLRNRQTSFYCPILLRWPLSPPFMFGSNAPSKRPRRGGGGREWWR